MQRSAELGVCRCCLGEGTFKRLASEHRWLGEKEVYIDMLRDCFGHKVLGGNENERLICEVCITRLRDACNFKKQVTNSEKFFHMSIGEQIKPTSSEDGAKPSKIEVKVEAADDNYDNSTTDEFAEDFVSVKMEDTKPDPDDPDDEPLSALSRTKSTTTHKTKPKAGLKMKSTRKRTAPQASTSTEHVKKETKGKSTYRKRHKLYSKERVNGKIINVKCVLCPEVFPNVPLARKHSKENHQAEYDVWNSVSSNRLDARKRKCGLCKHVFKSCEIWQHVQSAHDEKPLICDEPACGRVFQSEGGLKHHLTRKHNVRFRCIYCSEKFAASYDRYKHVRDVHEINMEFPCGACDKIFTRKAALLRHQRNSHLLERKFECNVCEYKCFTKRQLMDHMICHTKERRVVCSVCNKLFARVKALSLHMRIHNNDRRAVCKICGQAFVQRASLTYHMTKHHPGAAF